MKRFVVFGVLVLMLLVMVPGAFSYTIEDTYWGANAYTYEDVISADTQTDRNLFNIRGMDVAFSSGFMDVKVYTGFFEGVSYDHGYGTLYGDLFISTDGWNPTGNADDHYQSDNASNGEDWEFVFDTSENLLYGGTFSIVLSQNAPPQDGGSSFIVRDGQEVYRDPAGVNENEDIYQNDGSFVDLNDVATSLFNDNQANLLDPFPYLAYHISLESLAIKGGETIGLKWGMSCANDTIEGSVIAPVPEPGTLVLVGCGLAGLVWARRKSN